MGIVAALFYLKVRKVSDISMPRLKKEAANVGIKFTRGTVPPKEQLLFLLGKELLETGRLQRIDQSKVITRTNLVLNDDKCV